MLGVALTLHHHSARVIYRCLLNIFLLTISRSLSTAVSSRQSYLIIKHDTEIRHPLQLMHEVARVLNNMMCVRAQVVCQHAGERKSDEQSSNVHCSHITFKPTYIFQQYTWKC